MLYNLTEELIKRNHKIALFASGDSKTSAKLVAPIEKGIWLQRDLRSPHAAIIKLLKLLKEQIYNFDIIHNHFSFFPFPLLFCDRIPPMLNTIHRPLDANYSESIRLFPQIYNCALSYDAKEDAESQGVPVIDVVYNGIDPMLYDFNLQTGDYFVYLGRINKEKGITNAIQAAKEAGEKLIIAGNIVGAEEWNYFMYTVQPALNEAGINFIGQVDFKEKVRILKGAKALLFPIERREPFGLVMIEAMACGTPVIAFRRGSVPEIVVDKKTGFIVDNVNEMAKAVGKIDTIKREDCRIYVEKKFTIEKMIDNYEKAFLRIIQKNKNKLL